MDSSGSHFIDRITNIGDVIQTSQEDASSKRVTIELEEKGKSRVSATLWARYCNKLQQFMDKYKEGLARSTPYKSVHCIIGTVQNVNLDQMAALFLQLPQVVLHLNLFLEILPVIPRASREEIVLASLNSSYLWSSCKVNEYTLDLLPGEEKIYLSSDNICDPEPQSKLDKVYTIEFLDTISGSDLPYHQLKLKVSAPIMLLRNIDCSLGLCNGTRLILTRMSEHVLEASITSGKFKGEKVLIARMLISPSDSKLPFKFQRYQFPVVISFAMTINKSQGQTLSNVGTYLPRLVFSHGQLYVAVSHVRTHSSLKILVSDASRRQLKATTNVVFK
ncbi:ATP-dependent DNA helicase PIF1-like [Senna tora]|uniref:ATP-dependent DNA helicase n=1 Tax=Senna tora TaxID=362788 RepID=A0A834SG08_9FABA|nr:ATP-dependent DNA helicase PIF1-like [Senna tora]